MNESSTRYFETRDDFTTTYAWHVECIFKVYRFTHESN